MIRNSLGFETKTFFRPFSNLSSSPKRKEIHLSEAAVNPYENKLCEKD